MPAGLSSSRYLTFVASAMLTMFAGAQVVHMYYRPLDDLDELVQRELERRRAEKST
ncbi:uncharacterized protein C12orf73 homolog [Cephus cinctus]|uniref:Uncharacterized protein C12orf73 homolog n=1 Tax=Cephus cinctus TaxID=211228 RepID=A0AAJ7BP26_CEPCN|nr:uncharacterized protein C12orf73 homolog [Cephus cinctus]